MTEQDFAHADGCAYRLAALLRTMEEGARSLSETNEAYDHRLRCNDMAQLCELASGLTETIHDMMQLLHQAVSRDSH
ncbi:hypothetical protein [Devosia sp.]|uniref:hypothetical protein n=1 Tax=Devosia sp. TaxID=1871048 RepID=UPI001B1624DD|nr:hypothetical protein [Devosia sp.]MBO9589089.1 hypothetical protein [Devosia sp.]